MTYHSIFKKLHQRWKPTLKVDSYSAEDCHITLKVSIIVYESCKNLSVTNSINISFFVAFIQVIVISWQPNIGFMMNDKFYEKLLSQWLSFLSTEVTI